MKMYQIQLILCSKLCNIDIGRNFFGLRKLLENFSSNPLSHSIVHLWWAFNWCKNTFNLSSWRETPDD